MLCPLLSLQHHHPSSNTFRAPPGKSLLTSLLASSLAHPPSFPQRHYPLSFAIRITSESLPWPPRPSMEPFPGCVQPQAPLASHLMLHHVGPFVSPEYAQFIPALEPLCLIPLPGCWPHKIDTRSFFQALQRCSGDTQFKVAPCRPLSAYLLYLHCSQNILHPSLLFSVPWKAAPPIDCTVWLPCLLAASWVLPMRSESLGASLGVSSLPLPASASQFHTFKSAAPARRLLSKGSSNTTSSPRCNTPFIPSVLLQ